MTKREQKLEEIAAELDDVIQNVEQAAEYAEDDRVEDAISELEIVQGSIETRIKELKNLRR